MSHTLQRLQTLYHARNFRIFVFGDFASLIGNWVQRVGVGWLAWELTHSAAWLGIIGFAELGPALLMAPLGGILADRYNPRTVMIITQALRLLQALALCVLTLAAFINIWWLFGLSLFRGILASLNQPARQTIIPALVPREELPSAIAINALNYNIGRFIGPPIAGFAIAGVGVWLAFAINVATYFFMLFALWRIDIPLRKRRSPAAGKRAVVTEMVEGFLFVFNHTGILLILMVLTIVSFLVRPINEMLPGFADKVFSTDALGLAWMMSALGLGSIVGGYAVISRSESAALPRMLITNFAMLATTLVIFSLTNTLWLGLILLAALGYSFTVNGICTQFLIQSAVEDDLRGRVMSIYGLIIRGAPALGAVLIGILAEILGLGVPFLAAGVILALMAILAFLKRQAFIRATAPPE